MERITETTARAALLLLTLLVCGACRATQPAQAEEPTMTDLGPVEAGEEPPPADGEFLPTPYTSEQIRAAHPAGAFHVYRVERTSEAPVVETMRFVQVDEKGAMVESDTADANGHALSPIRSSISTWEGFRDHARFPAATARRERAEVEVPAGSYACWLYVVDVGDGSVSRYWFADEEPGPPVLLEVDVGGTVVYRMALLQVSRPR